jgi:hypothetical protein
MAKGRTQQTRFLAEKGWLVNKISKSKKRCFSRLICFRLRDGIGFHLIERTGFNWQASGERQVRH